MRNASTPADDRQSDRPSTLKPTARRPKPDLKSFVRKILLASPMFPRLYADVVIASAPNSPEAKILARNYKKIVDRVNAQIHPTPTQPERTNILMSHPKSCTHIKVTGVRCGSPALRGEQFCYFHQRMLRTVRVPDSRVRHVALLEDEASIQVSLMEVVNALLRGTIELKRAELILRALNTAVRNIRHVKFGLHADEMVKEVPTYSTEPIEETAEQVTEPAPPAPRRRPTGEEIDRRRAADLAEYYAGTKQASAPAATTARVGTAAPGCPSGPAVPGRSAVELKPAEESPEAITRKPPISVKEASAKAAPKERKNAAHGASRGRPGRH